MGLSYESCVKTGISYAWPLLAAAKCIIVLTTYYCSCSFFATFDKVYNVWCCGACIPQRHLLLSENTHYRFHSICSRARRAHQIALQICFCIYFVLPHIIFACILAHIALCRIGCKEVGLICIAWHVQHNLNSNSTYLVAEMAENMTLSICGAGMLAVGGVCLRLAGRRDGNLRKWPSYFSNGECALNI